MKRTILLSCRSGPLQGDTQRLLELLARCGLGNILPQLMETSTPQQLLQALDQQLRHYDLFVLAVEPAQYHRAKAQLLEGLRFATRLREDIFGMQAVPCPEDAMFPPRAKVFLTESAVFNGFALQCGGQDMLMAPLNERLLAQMSEQICRYLRALTPLRVLHPGEFSTPSEMDVHLTRLGQLSTAPVEPIDAASIVPLAPAKLLVDEPELDLPIDASMVSAPNEWVESYVPTQTYEDPLAVATQSVRQILEMLSLQQAQFALLLPTQWREIADFVASLGGSHRLHPVFLEQGARNVTEALQACGQLLLPMEYDYCQTVTLPSNENGVPQCYAVLQGPADYTQIRQLERNQNQSISEEIPAIAKAMFLQLREALELMELPASAGDMLPEPVELAPYPQRKGRSRAVAAASMALASLMTSVFLSFYFKNDNQAAMVEEQPVVTEQAVAAAQAGLKEGLNQLSQLIAQQDEEGLTQAAGVAASMTEADVESTKDFLFNCVSKTHYIVNSLVSPVFRAVCQVVMYLRGEPLPTAAAPRSIDIGTEQGKEDEDATSAEEGLSSTQSPNTTAATTQTTTTTATQAPTTTTRAATTTTTAAPPSTTTTTAAPPSTTQPTTTTTTTITTTQAPAAKGVYRFTVIGFGHGVGLSQEGARIFAKQGWDYERIIKHYYYSSGIGIGKESPRANITHAGKSYPVREYLARIAYGEIGGPNQTADEAIKCQMVCSYTVAKRTNYSTTENNQHMLPEATWNSNFAQSFKTKLYALADAVLGQYITYNGGVADNLFFASCAGATGSAKYAWSDKNDPAPYLAGGRSSPEAFAYSYPAFTTDQLRTMVKTYNDKNPGNAITLGSDASQWLKILSKDEDGYVQYIQIGNRTFTGGLARLYFFTPANLRSHNFTMAFE
jgi:peptidoglycan hydrolase-like amidase